MLCLLLAAWQSGIQLVSFLLDCRPTFSHTFFALRSMLISISTNTYFAYTPWPEHGCYVVIKSTDESTKREHTLKPTNIQIISLELIAKPLEWKQIHAIVSLLENTLKVKKFVWDTREVFHSIQMSTVSKIQIKIKKVIEGVVLFASNSLPLCRVSFFLLPRINMRKIYA